MGERDERERNATSDKDLDTENMYCLELTIPKKWSASVEIYFELRRKKTKLSKKLYVNVHYVAFLRQNLSSLTSCVSSCFPLLG